MIGKQYKEAMQTAREGLEKLEKYRDIWEPQQIKWKYLNFNFMIDVIEACCQMNEEEKTIDFIKKSFEFMRDKSDLIQLLFVINLCWNTELRGKMKKSMV